MEGGGGGGNFPDIVDLVFPCDQKSKDKNLNMLRAKIAFKMK